MQPPDPGPSSIPSTLGTTQAPPTQLPVAGYPGLISVSSPVPQISLSRYTQIWNTPTGAWSYPVAPHASHSSPTFTNPLPTYPSFPPSTFVRSESVPVQETPNSSSTVVPDVNQDTQTTQPPAPDVLNPSLRMPSQSPCSSDSDSEDDGAARPNSSKRIRVPRRNPTQSFVEGAMVGNQGYCKYFCVSRSLFQVFLRYSTALVRKQAVRDLQTNGALAGKRFKRQIDDLISRVTQISNRYMV